MSKKILVYGWYHKSNIGDDLFIDAFQNLFPEFEFSFVDKFIVSDIEQSDAIFIGGGSFLYDAPKGDPKAIQLLKNKPIFYIGVGSETQYHEVHLSLMKVAKLIAIRNTDGFSRIKTSINSNVIVIPDIIYSLHHKVINDQAIDKSILVLPNITLVPQNSDPHWKFAAWEYFKSEFSQFLDVLIDTGYKLDFFSMCNNKKACDSWAAIEIINKMKFKNSDWLLPQASGITEVSKVFSKYQSIITQRFHGIILSEMLNIPYIALHHHDKLKGNDVNRGTFISYYNVNKNKLLDEFFLLNSKNNKILPIECDMFTDLKNKVLSIISE
jgi:polysaccharide pyruvyl transferase WcaK-like protein